MRESGTSARIRNRSPVTRTKCRVPYSDPYGGRRASPDTAAALHPPHAAYRSAYLQRRWCPTSKVDAPRARAPGAEPLGDHQRVGCNDGDVSAQWPLDVRPLPDSGRAESRGWHRRVGGIGPGVEGHGWPGDKGISAEAGADETMGVRLARAEAGTAGDVRSSRRRCADSPLFTTPPPGRRASSPRSHPPCPAGRRGRPMPTRRVRTPPPSYRRPPAP